MANERVIGRTSEIPPGEGRTFEVDGKRIAVFHARTGGFFATQADCPHKGGPLADGLLGGTTVVCPLHDRSWDLATGTPAAGSDCPIEVYPIRAAEDGTVVRPPPCRRPKRRAASAAPAPDTGNLSGAVAP